MHTKSTLTALALSLAIGSATVSAAAAATGAMDQDTSGTIDLREFEGFGRSAFGAWDTDGDGRLTRAEFQAGFRAAAFFDGYRGDDVGTFETPVTRTANTEYLFAAWDNDRDGVLTAGEFFNADAFVSIDLDGNDALTYGELKVRL